MDILILLPVLLFSVVVHEVGHALVAKWEGDDTAYKLGRITLNPIPHLDPMGSIIVPLVLFFMPGDFLFGWAKPVPVNPRNFRDPRWGDIRVSLAGIVGNILLVVISTILLAAFLKIRQVWGDLGGVLPILILAASYGRLINLILAVFNLIPIPPLDGSRVLFHLLPPRAAIKYQEVGRYGVGVIMLMVFVFPGAFSLLFWPVGVLLSITDLFIGLWI